MGTIDVVREVVKLCDQLRDSAISTALSTTLCCELVKEEASDQDIFKLNRDSLSTIEKEKGNLDGPATARIDASMRLPNATTST